MTHPLTVQLHKLWVGFRLHCPNCEQGSTSDSLFAMRDLCPVCSVRFERQSGESVGGMYLNLGIAEMLTIGGFFVAHGLFAPPLTPHLIFWVVFNVVFVAWFYRRARSMWIAVNYLTGGVQTDEAYQKTHPTQPKVIAPFRDQPE
jgi:uncharacterized protein (DUF983 family)